MMNSYDAESMSQGGGRQMKFNSSSKFRNNSIVEVKNN